MDPTELERALQLNSIFMPSAYRRLNAFLANKKRVVHYTSAENLLSTIRSKTMWLRSTNCMVDYREVYAAAMSQRASAGRTSEKM